MNEAQRAEVTGIDPDRLLQLLCEAAALSSRDRPVARAG
jgi:hypothetical protein